MIQPIRVCLIAPKPPPYGGISNWVTIITEYARKQPNIDFTVLDISPRWRSVYCDKIFLRVIGGALQLLRDLAACRTDNRESGCQKFFGYPFYVHFSHIKPYQAHSTPKKPQLAALYS